MNLTEQIIEDLKNAMKEKDTLKLNVIRDIKSGIQLKKIELKHDLSDEEVIDVISKKIKMRNDSIAEFQKASRNDLVESYSKEIEILKKYMPQELTEEEVNKIIEDAFNEIKPTSMKDMGIIMKTVTPKTKGRFDAGKISSIIKNKLSHL